MFCDIPKTTAITDYNPGVDWATQLIAAGPGSRVTHHQTAEEIRASRKTAIPNAGSHRGLHCMRISHVPEQAGSIAIRPRPSARSGTEWPPLLAVQPES